MDKEKIQKTKSNIKELVIVVVVIAICIMVVSFLKQFEEIPKTDVQILQDILDNKTGMSNDYRQGFNDCINELQKLHPKVGDTT